MIVRTERSAPLRVPAAMPWERRQPPARPAGSILSMARGEIAGDVRLLRRDQRERLDTYEVLVANDTAAPLAAFAYAVETGRERALGHMTWNAMVVPAHSAVAVEIDVAIPRRGKAPRVVAEVHSEDAQLTLDSAQPLARYSGAAVRRVAASAAIAVLAAGTFAGLATLRPRVAAVAAPQQVVAGSGTHLTALVAQPQTPAPRVRQPASAAIAELGLQSETVAAGTPIVVDYRTAAHAGTVRLIDEYGTVRAEALLSRSGKSLLVAPLVEADQDLRVVVTAERGAARGEAEVPVRVLAATPQAIVPAVAPIPPDLGAGRAAVRRAVTIPHGPPIAVARVQAANAPIVVRVLRHEPKMHVAVLGNSGEELEGADVGPADALVTLSSPRELGTSRPAVIATYAHGSEQETVVRQLTVRGRVGRK
jgi:hypothetical protein